jgi:anti-sigma-K factor RskA
MITEEAERRQIELLLPWYAVGTLSRNESDHVEKALAADVELARRYALVLEELAEANNLNEALGEPSASVAETLFAAIDVEGARAPRRQRLDRPAPNAELSAGTPWPSGPK